MLVQLHYYILDQEDPIFQQGALIKLRTLATNVHMFICWLAKFNNSNATL